MTTLADLANLIRSKNAGPFVLCFDILFNSEKDYQRVKKSGALSREKFAELYGCPVDIVRFYESDNALGFKFSIPRKIFQGDIGDSDLHGGQQYAPLMAIEIP